MTLKIYLAARFGRHHEIEDNARNLEKEGYYVVSTWHTPERIAVEPELVDDADYSIPYAAGTRVAFQDLEELRTADVVLAFTEPARSAYGRGGRHIEAGIALGMGKILVAIGYRENVFYCLDRVEHFDDYGYRVLKWLQQIALERSIGPVKG